MEHSRTNFENNTIKPFYNKYKNNESVDRSFDYKDGLYFFITLQEQLGDDFVAKLERYWIENSNLPKGIDFVAYAVADIYGVNLIPYIELYGLSINNSDIYDKVIELSSSTLFYNPDTSSFDEFKNLSTPVTLNGIYEGGNSVLSGIPNKNSKITLDINTSIFNITEDDNDKFDIIIPDEIWLCFNIILILKHSLINFYIFYYLCDFESSICLFLTSSKALIKSSLSLKFIYIRHDTESPFSLILVVTLAWSSRSFISILYIKSRCTVSSFIFALILFSSIVIGTFFSVLPSDIFPNLVTVNEAPS